MAKKFLTDIDIAGGIYDSSGDIGSSGQVLSSTGSGLNWIDSTASSSVIYQDAFSGNGSATAFTLANSVDNENKTQVYIDGVYQFKNTYSISGTTLTFSTAPPNNTDIEVISFNSITADGDILTDSEFGSAGLMTTNGSGVYSITTNNSSNWNTAYTYSQVGHLPLAGGAITGAITTNSTFDGRDVSVDGTKLDGIEANATADQTNAEIRAAVEAATNSNVFTDADHTKLNAIEASADVTDTVNVTAAGALMDSELTDLAGIKAVTISDLATETYVDTAVSDLVDSSPATLNTLNELAAALGDDPNFATTTANSIGTKLPLAGGTMTGTLTIADSGASDNPLILGSSSQTSYTLQQWQTSSHGTNEAYIIAYGAGHGSQAGNFAMKNIESGGEIFFELASGVEPLRLTSTSATFAGTINGSGIELSNYMQIKVDDAEIYWTNTANNDYWRWKRDASNNFICDHYNGSSTTAALTFSASGNVGIGTTAPLSKLTVSEGTNQHGIELAPGTLSYLQCYDRATSTYGNMTIDAKYLAFGLNNGAEKIRFTADGYIGIGTTSPSRELDIQAGSGWAEIALRGASGAGGSLEFWTSTTKRAEIFADTEDIVFRNTATNQERMRIHSNGRVSIGSTTASANTLTLSGTGTELDLSNTSSSGKNYRIASTSSGVLEFIDKAANVERMRIHSDGSVGIGATPTNKLHVSAGTTNIVAQFQSTDGTGGIMLKDSSGNVELTTSGTHGFNIQPNGGSTVFRVDQDGNVGIGTSSPSYKLHVSGTGGTRMSITNTDTNWAALQIQAKGNQADYIFFKDDTEERARIAALDSSDLVFYNTDSVTERLRINSSGNVGIGTTSPAARLHVENTNAAIVYVKSTVNNQNASIWFNSNSGGTQADRWEIGTNISAGTDLEFFDRLNSVSRMVIQNDGNVGIGTISPNEKLQVAGNIHAYAPSGIDAGLFASTAAGSTTIAIRSNGATHFNGGNVGIGVTSPSAKLDVFRTINVTSDNDTGYVNSALILNSTESNARGAGVFMHNTNDDAEFYMGVPYAAGFDKWMVAFKSTTSHTDSTSEEANAKFIVESNGDVLIGGVSVQGARTVSFDVSTNGVVHDNCTTSGAGNGWEFQTFRRNNGSNSVQIGSIVMNGTSGITYATSSDYRLKENVVKLTNALDRIDQLKPSRFNFISDKGRTVDGFLAHEVQDIVPEAIVGTKDEVDEDDNPKYQSIDQSKIVPLLVAAIQELKAEIEILKNK